MEWQRPEALFLILPVLAAWLGLALLSRARKRRAARKFVDAAMAPRILPMESSARFWLKLLCMEAALLCGLIAIAGPRFGEYYEQVKARGSDVYVMIDVSKSMLADDVPPNRLARAKNDVSSLLNTLNGERVGLIAFAGKAVVKCPLTTDYGFFRLALNDLDPNSAPRGGTAIGDAIRKGLEVFPAEAERDRAIILITDGDDQESYPLEAAAQAAERRVLVFTIGLGDSTQGARVPATRDGKLTFLEHDGQQVWSKLNHGLLKDIALKTRGAYIPAGTKAYDLGQLYKDHLRSLNGADSKQTQRVRRHERFQLFLGLALFFLLLDILIKPYAPATTTVAAPSSNGRAALATLFALLFIPFAHAGDANKALSDGIEAYKKDDFDKAVEKFSTATDALKDAQTEELSAIAAFNLACAYQRKGDTANARDHYLKAGLAKDKKIASEAHYNLGTLSADAARAAAGEKPEEVPPEKREEILKNLKDAVSSFRQALNAKKDHVEARKNLELVLQWIKVYSDKWREFDRMKRREELNLPQFLEFMITAEKALRASTKALPENARRDAYAELKRAQDELEEEIPWLNRKIKAEFDKMTQEGQKIGQVTQGQAPKVDTKQVDEAVKMLQDWSEEAGKLMKAASEKLQERQPRPAAMAELQAIRELERIWETIVPFRPMLQRALADQTSITKTLKPDSTPAPVAAPLAPPEKRTVTNDSLLADDVTELQEDTLRRTSLLKYKAEAELKQVEQQPQPAPAPQPGQPGQPQQPDPEKVKEGLRKAIELAPKAAEKETSALKFMKQKDHDGAYPDAEEARKILEEIAKAQPEDPNQNQDQQNKDQNKDQQKKDQQDQKDKKDEEKKDEQKQDPKDKKDEKKDEGQKGQPKEEKVPLNKDQLEDILRRVREREKSKMERDKKQKAILSGPGSVDKDW